MNIKSVVFIAKRTDKYIFDGLERDMFANVFQVDTIDCVISFRYEELSGMEMFDGMKSENIDKMIRAFKLKKIDIGYKEKLMTFNQLDPYFLIRQCGGREFLVCLGISELQPARYVVFLQSVALIG